MDTATMYFGVGKLRISYKILVVLFFLFCKQNPLIFTQLADFKMHGYGVYA